MSPIVPRRPARPLLVLALGLLAMSAGGFDVCCFSLVLGGPFSGAACRAEAGRADQLG